LHTHTDGGAYGGPLAIAVSVRVGLAVAVSVGVGVAVAVSDGVAVGVLDGGAVTLGVAVGVLDGGAVALGVRVGVRVPVGATGEVGVSVGMRTMICFVGPGVPKEFSKRAVNSVSPPGNLW
jgi:hypothetical protein